MVERERERIRPGGMFTFGALVFLLLIAPRVVHSAPAGWHAIYNQGKALDDRKSYAEAISRYERALTLVPATDLNATTRLRARLSIDYLRLRQYDKGQKYSEQVATYISRWRKSDSFDPDLLLEENDLLEAWQQTALSRDVPYPLRPHVELVSTNAQIDLVSAANPNDPMLLRLLSTLSRAYLSSSQFENSEECLKRLTAKLTPKNENYRTVRERLAAVQAHLGRPQLQNQILNENRKQFSAAESLSLIADSERWVGDYIDARRRCAEALRLMDKTAPDAALVEAKINLCMGCTFADCADFKNEEPYLVKAYNLLSPHYKQTPIYDTVSGELFRCLKSQNKMKEAAAILPLKNNKPNEIYADRYKRYGDLLSDDEQAQLKKKP